MIKRIALAAFAASCWVAPPSYAEGLLPRIRSAIRQLDEKLTWNQNHRCPGVRRRVGDNVSLFTKEPHGPGAFPEYFFYDQSGWATLSVMADPGKPFEHGCGEAYLSFDAKDGDVQAGFFRICPGKNPWEPTDFYERNTSGEPEGDEIARRWGRQGEAFTADIESIVAACKL